MSMCYYKNENIKPYRSQFLKTEPLSSGPIKSAKNWVETDLSKDKHLTVLISSLSLSPSSHANIFSSLSATCSLTHLGLCTCCSPAWSALFSTAYLENSCSSFKISKHHWDSFAVASGSLRHSFHCVTSMYLHCSNHVVAFYIFSCLLARLHVSWEQGWVSFTSVLQV